MPQHPLSRLNTDGQQYVSACCREFHSRLQQHAPRLLEEQIQKAPSDARFALLCELLPIEIEHIKLRTGRLPTLHELCHAHPKLKEYLPKAYDWVPQELRLPGALGRYKVLKVLGEGGQGCVVQARDELDDRLVAIKYASHPAHISLLRREQMFLSQLAHKNIIEVLGAGDEPGMYYIVLPLRRGESLQLAYAQHRPDPSLAAEIMLQIARAIAHMHATSVVHRDIKPGNIHLDPESSVETVVLLDLGMAVDVGAWNAEDRRILEHGGTKAYMAPEQFASDESSDPKLSDVFALGAVLYFLLVGEPPLDRAAVLGTLQKTKAPATLKAICQRSLQLRPADRQASAVEFARELDQFLAVTTTRRTVARFVLPATSLAVMLASGFLIWTYAGPGSTSGGPHREDVQSPEAQAVDYSDVNATDFHVSIEPDTESRWGIGGASPLLRFPGKLAVQGNASTDALLAGAEFRFHDGAWDNFYRDPRTGRFTAELTEVDLRLRGPLYVRFATPAGSAFLGSCGPFRYPVYLDESLSDIKKQLVKKIAERWKDEDLKWIGNSVFAPEWKLKVNKYELPWTPVVELRFGPAATAMDHSVNVASRGLETIVGRKEGADEAILSAFHRLGEEFERQVAPMKDSHSLFAQLHFFDGSKSEVREFRADIHPQSEQSIRLRKHVEGAGFGAIAKPLVDPALRPKVEGRLEKQLRESLRPPGKE